MNGQPNVLFLLSDEHNFRYFSHLDPSTEGEPVHTPTFDAMAAKSCVLDQTYCQMPLCTPSRLCMLTGRDVRGAGAWSNGSMLRPDLPTLPGVMADAGYETCLVGKMHFGGNRQFGGFRLRPYGDMTGACGHQSDPIVPEHRHEDGMRHRTVDAGVTEIPESLLQEQAVARESIAFLREHRHRNPGQPWFLCASLSRPHFPLTAPRRYFERYWPEGITRPKTGRTGDTVDHPMTLGMAKGFKVEDIEDDEMMKARAAYFACVDYLDEVIGDMLASMNRDDLLENTIVIYSSDHGEMAGEHGMWWKNSWHEGCTRVPFFLQLPEHRSGEIKPSRLRTPSSLADLFPTVCGLCGVESPADLDGVDLSEAIRRGSEPESRAVFFDALIPRWGKGTEFRAVRDGKYKYVGFRNAPELLFDLEADPLEQKNLATEITGEAGEALERFRRLVEETMDFEAIDGEREADVERARDASLSIPRGTGNTYILPDGRLIDADGKLYTPDVLAEDPSNVIADWPE